MTAAARAGTLSPEQAVPVSDAVAADRLAEARLVDLASRASIGELRDACQRVKTAADGDPEATHERIRAARRLRTWTDVEGAWNVSGRSVAEDGAEIHAALEDLATQLFERARADRRSGGRDAYLLDALVELARRHNELRRSGDATGAVTKARKRRPAYTALLRLDLEALKRGWIEGEEQCEISGVGPIPVRVAKELLGDATLKLVLTRGVDVANVTHLGRGPSAAQKVAMLWSNPFCSREGCDERWTQADHRVDWATVKVTELRNLDGFCDHDHNMKTRRNWALVSGTGKRPMVPPDDSRHPDFRGPAPP